MAACQMRSDAATRRPNLAVWRAIWSWSLRSTFAAMFRACSSNSAESKVMERVISCARSIRPADLPALSL